jgi:16S rRNA processing protein RimM
LTLAARVAPADLLSIGRVSRAHGLRGELRVELHFAGSDALEHVDELWLAEGFETPDGARVYSIEAARAVPKAYLVKLAGVDDRNAAELLQKRSVWVPRSALPASEDESEYYLVDLIGAKVVGPEGEIGTVVEIATHPSVDSIVIRTADGRTLEQPLVPDWIARVSVAEKLVELSTLEGLIG